MSEEGPRASAANTASPKPTLGFDDWVQERTPLLLSTNAGTPEIAFQDWKRFKEAFAPELVKRAVDETAADLGRTVETCSDPFGGSGTTALACQFLNVAPSTIEVNPFLADLIEAKLSSYPDGILEDAFSQVVGRVDVAERAVSAPFSSAPATFVEAEGKDRFLFWLPVARRLAAYSDVIETLEDVIARRFFRVMLASITVSVSNAFISGKGRRYRRGWQARPVDASAVDTAFHDACLRATYQVRRYGGRPRLDYNIYRGDSRQLVHSLGKHDLSVFSPPYPNSFDYTDVYNIELWTGGYLSSGGANRRLRESTLRSHVQIKRSFSTRPTVSPTLIRTIDQLRQVRSVLWNSAIPEMVDAYFEDMRCVLEGLRAKLSSGGRVYMVVGDSRYAGVDVPVAAVLTEEAADLGFEVLGSEPCRSMRASPQQGGRAELAETLLTFRVD